MDLIIYQIDNQYRRKEKILIQVTFGHYTLSLKNVNKFWTFLSRFAVGSGVGVAILKLFCECLKDWTNE